MGDVSVLPLFVVFVVVMLVGSFLYQRHREKLLRTWAASVGWTYVGADPSLVTRWSGEPFGRGSSRKTSEVVTGLYRGRPAVSFAYRDTTGSGKNRSVHTFHVVATTLPAFLPTLELTPDGLGARIAKAFGGQDLEVESEAFNQVWRVEAADPKFAHDVVHPRLMERLLRPDARGMSLRVEGTDILSWRPGASNLDTVASRLDVLGAVVDAVPPFVWQDHGYDPART